MGKAMVVCIDKATAVRMYDKVRKHWKVFLDALTEELPGLHGAYAEDAKAKIAFRPSGVATFTGKTRNQA